MQDRETICIYAAQLQDLGDSDGFENYELWMMRKMKTLNGYWSWEYGDGMRRLDQIEEESEIDNVEMNEFEQNDGGT
jgi:hypothetical protein